VDTSGLDGYEWPDTLSRWFDAIYSAAREQPEVAARLAHMVADYSGWHFTSDDPGRALQPPANMRLGEIHAPALVIVGERGLPFYNLPIADRLSQCIPHAQKVTIPHAGHMANMEAPESFNHAVLAFLSHP
jgi:pimeloyl-ACP methyl ester carboxylesterase